MDAARWAKIEALYHSAAGWDPAERTARLRAACGGDEELLREVESLLAADASPAFLLDRPLSFDSSGAIAAGSEIASYRIESVLGAGGMGVVYRATDTRLKRPVALKVLAEEMATVSARRRFQLEAQAASALNHPHIVTVYDVGEFDGRQYLVTEFVDGGTLREWTRLQRREWRQIVELLVGVADGLAVAHDAGILHRDIKPDNILLSRSGYAKLGDFGLAKLQERLPSEQASTVTENTGVGVILGTIPYMAPEQAAGKAVDARSDIFSFGVVLYEAVAGARPFRAANDRDLLYAIVHDTPAPLPRDLPPLLRSAVEKAIEKIPAERYQSAGELVVDLRRVLRASEQIAAPPPRRRTGLVAVVAIAVLAAAIAGGYFLRRVPAPVSQTDWVQLTHFSDSATSPALSPDGHLLAFLRSSDTFYAASDVYVKLLPDGEPTALTHDHLVKMGPAVSPDGSRVAYTVVTDNFNWNTFVAPLLGGDPRSLLPNAEGLSWIGPKTVLFSEIKGGAHMGIVTANEDRSQERAIYLPPHERGMAHRSYLSPNRKDLLIVEMGGNAEWLPCRLTPFDGSAPGRAIGPANGSCTSAAWSPDGEWMYFSSDAGGDGYHLWRQRYRGGDPQQITFGPTVQEGIAMMPDGRSLVSSVGLLQSSIWIHGPDGERPVTSEESASMPVFSHDRTTLYYLSGTWNMKPQGELWKSDLNGGHREQVVGGYRVTDYDVSPDDRQVAFTAPGADGRLKLWIAPIDHRTAPRQLPGPEILQPKFLPDGDLAFLAVEGKLSYLYRSRPDGSDRRKMFEFPVLEFWGVSRDGGWALLWTAVPGKDDEARTAILLYPTDGGAPVRICDDCYFGWGPDGKFAYFSVGGNMYRAPVAAGKVMPPMPPSGIETAAEVMAIPGAVQLSSNGSLDNAYQLTEAIQDAATYAFVKVTVHRNLYRIPLP